MTERIPKTPETHETRVQRAMLDPVYDYARKNPDLSDHEIGEIVMTVMTEMIAAYCDQIPERFENILANFIGNVRKRKAFYDAHGQKTFIMRRR